MGMRLRRTDFTVQTMLVIMVMVIHRQFSSQCITKKVGKFWALTYTFGCAGTAQMTIEANDFIGCRHHNMQIVRDQ